MIDTLLKKVTDKETKCIVLAVGSSQAGPFVGVLKANICFGRRVPAITDQ